MITNLAVVAVWAEDVPRLVHFYQNVVGLERMHAHGGSPHFKVGEVVLVIIQGSPSPASNADPEHFPIMAFAVDDLEKEMEKLAGHEVNLLGQVEERANARWVMFHDPAGNLLEYVQYLQLASIP